jgi:CheY-like chemotaxis protein
LTQLSSAGPVLEGPLIDVNFGSRNQVIPESPVPKRECLSNPHVILCVDDEVAALALRRLVLSTAGYEVLTAADGVAALELFRCIHVDLVITDHRLPGLTGTQLAAEMKRLKPAIRIVLFSGLVEAPLGSEHVDLVITKGMPAVEFLREVGKLIPK